MVTRSGCQPVLLGNRGGGRTRRLGEEQAEAGEGGDEDWYEDGNGGWHEDGDWDEKEHGAAVMLDVAVLAPWNGSVSAGSCHCGATPAGWARRRHTGSSPSCRWSPNCYPLATRISRPREGDEAAPSDAGAKTNGVEKPAEKDEGGLHGAGGAETTIVDDEMQASTPNGKVTRQYEYDRDTRRLLTACLFILDVG